MKKLLLAAALAASVTSAVLVVVVETKDSFGFSWSNTQGQFYKDHTKPNSLLFKVKICAISVIGNICSIIT